MNTTIIKLNEDLLFSEGASRKCYFHPLKKNKCLKVQKDGKFDINERDLNAHNRVREILSDFIVGCDSSLIETNLGPALSSELILNPNGEPATSYIDLWKEHQIPESIKQQLTDFFTTITHNNLFFYDVNPRNFLIQETQTGPRLLYTDLKSLNRVRTFIALEKIPFFARKKLKRRIQRFKTKYLMPDQENTINT